MIKLMDYNNYTDLPELPSVDELTEDEQTEVKVKALAIGCATYIIGIGIVGLLCMLLGACAPQRELVTVERVVTDTVRENRTVRDSIYVHDSVNVTHWGDTVFVDRWHTSYRDRWRTDTVYRSRTDSVPVPYAVEKEVPAELTWWQQTRLHLANIMLWTAGLMLGLYLIRRKF